MFEVHDKERSESGTAIRLVGELDLCGVAAFRKAVEPALSGSDDLILDGSQLVFIGSEAIRAIVDVSRRLGEDRRLVLAGLQHAVHRVLEIMQLPELLRNVDVVEPRVEQAP